MAARMVTGDGIAMCVLILISLGFGPVLSVASACELSVRHGNTVYNYSLSSPTPKHPHGALSEDGFYMVSVNGTSLWFQLCDQMIFNHDPPRCIDCQDCGGSSHCGMKCSALVANDIGGYPVCRTVGRASNLDLTLIDKNNPRKGVVVKMSANGRKRNCSLAVSVFCDKNEAKAPKSLDIAGDCAYSAELRHPAGCAKIISANGKGFGWFATLLVVILCLLGGYLLAGTAYRFFALGIRGVEAIPNLEFWISLPQSARSMLGSLVRRLRGLTQGGHGSYSPVDN